ncbi:hypothetical protein PRBEI_2000044800 [Prionailurus iriomotensis]
MEEVSIRSPYHLQQRRGPFLWASIKKQRKFLISAECQGGEQTS